MRTLSPVWVSVNWASDGLARGVLWSTLRIVSLDQLKREVASLNSQEQAELIAYALHLRYAGDPEYRREVTDRLNDRDKSHWLTPEEFERRLGSA